MLVALSLYVSVLPACLLLLLLPSCEQKTWDPSPGGQREALCRLRREESLLLTDRQTPPQLPFRGCTSPPSDQESTAPWLVRLRAGRLPALLKGGPSPIRHMDPDPSGSAHGEDPPLSQEEDPQTQKKAEEPSQDPSFPKDKSQLWLGGVSIPEAQQGASVPCSGRHWAGRGPCLCSPWGPLPLSDLGWGFLSFCLPASSASPPQAGAWVFCWGGDSLHGRLLCGIPPGWEELGSPKLARVQSELDGQGL